VTYEVIIVGAGPGGSMAALVLARAGKRVLVLEKSTFPRAKVCGCSLHPRCRSLLQRYGLVEQFQRLPHFVTAGFTLEHEGTPIARHPFNGNGTRPVERGIFDQWLAREAQDSGAVYQFGKTVRSIAGGRVTTSSGECEAPIVIGADGRNSIVGRMSRLARTSRPCGRMAWQAFIDAPSLREDIHMNIFPEGYYGINRIDATRANISMVLYADARVSPREIADRYLPGSSCRGWKSLHPISRRPWEITNGRTWLVGDAARILEPLTGEGIYSAMATAEMAAQHILSIETVGIDRAVARYRCQHHRFYGSRTFVNSMVRWALEDSSRSRRLVHGLKRWPGLVNRMVDWVHRPEKSAPTLAEA